MSHAISAILLCGDFSLEVAESYDLKPIALSGKASPTTKITLFPLTAQYVDHWAERLNNPENVAEVPMLNAKVVHDIVIATSAQAHFAIMETDYFGGDGTQAAAVYRGRTEVMAPTSGKIGPINAALKHLGVVTTTNSDEFDTLELHRFRSFDDLHLTYPGKE